MENWFTVEKIDKDTFAISEYKHWEKTHCYLLCGTTKAVLIDTGLGVSNIKKVIDSITKLPVTVMTTHVHWDHIGGHRYFNNICVHTAEQEWLTSKFPLSLQAVKNNLICKPCDFPTEFNVDDYTVFQGNPTRILIDGDVIDLGNRKIKVIHTPGHHKLFIPVDIIGRIEKAFEQLETSGQLKQGSGIFDFDDFQIHI